MIKILTHAYGTIFHQVYNHVHRIDINVLIQKELRSQLKFLSWQSWTVLPCGLNVFMILAGQRNEFLTWFPLPWIQRGKTETWRQSQAFRFANVRESCWPLWVFKAADIFVSMPGIQHRNSWMHAPPGAYMFQSSRESTEKPNVKGITQSTCFL